MIGLKENELRSLAEKLVEFKKEHDFYGYQDALEVGETDEERIAKVSEHLKDLHYCHTVIEELLRG